LISGLINFRSLLLSVIWGLPRGMGQPVGSGFRGLGGRECGPGAIAEVRVLDSESILNPIQDSILERESTQNWLYQNRLFHSILCSSSSGGGTRRFWTRFWVDSYDSTVWWSRINPRIEFRIGSVTVTVRFLFDSRHRIESESLPELTVNQLGINNSDFP
jgi:hypothetical protein